MDVEEEPLLPLVRHRKTHTVEHIHTKHETINEDLKKNNEDIKSDLPYGGKVYLKRQKKPDHYYVIILEVIVILRKLDYNFIIRYFC